MATIRAVVVHRVDALLGADEIDRMVRVWHRFPFYDAVNQRPMQEPGQATELPAEPAPSSSSDIRTLTPHTDGSTPALPQRFPGLAGRADVDMHFRQTGCAAGRAALHAGLARTNYFGANYAYHDQTAVPGIEKFLHHEDFIEAARLIFDLPLVVPTLVYANVMLPGQELPLHTDIPEFLGADRSQLPMWLLVVMHHSGLFEDRRIATATAVAYVEGGVGGEFVCYETNGEEAALTPTPGSAVVLDADSVFHAVLPVGVEDDQPPVNRASMRLHRHGERQWRLSGRSADSDADEEPETMATYSSDNLRYSVSRKAYCFADQQHYQAWQQGVDPLDPDMVLGRLTETLAERGVLDPTAHPLGDHELATLLINEFIPFPDTADSDELA